MALEPNLSIENNHYLIENDTLVTCCLLLGKNYLSYILADQSSLKIYALKHYSFEDKVIGKADFDAILSDEQLRKANNYHIAIDSLKFTLIPNEFFSAENLNAYLELTCELDPEEIVRSQEISEGITEAYAIKSSTIHFLESRLSNITFYNAAGCLLKTYPLQIISEHQHSLFVSVKDHQACMTIYHKQALLLHQMYAFEAPEDILYYIANAVKQFDINKEQLGIQIHGESQSTEQIYKSVQPYFVYVRYCTRIKDLQYPDTLYATPAHSFFNLFSILSCVL